MRVGLISKPEHCRPHAKAIKALGVKVEVLGGDPTMTIPNRIDVVVVRTCSISHTAFGKAKAWERDGGTVFYEEGATKAAQAVQEFIVATATEKVMGVMEKVPWMHWHLLLSLSDDARTEIGVGHLNDGMAQFIGMAPSTVRGAINKASEALGWTRIQRAVNTSSGRPVTIHINPKAPYTKVREQQVDLFVKEIHAMQAPKQDKEPDILKIREQLLEAEKGRPEPFGFQELPEIPSKTVVDANTEGILTVMADMDTLRSALEEVKQHGQAERIKIRKMYDDLSRRCAVLEAKASVATSLETRLRNVEGKMQDLINRPRTSPTIVMGGKSDTEKRFEELRAEMKAEVQKAVEMMAQHPSPGVNPFDVIEKFKVALASSGFRGTLSLTIGEGG